MRVLHSSETNNEHLIEEVPNSSTLEERLLELNDLKVRNVISETEYEELRKSAIEKQK